MTGQPGPPAESGTSAQPIRRDEPALADLALGVLALGMFSTAALKTFDWSFRTALFPRIVTAAGVVLSVLFLLLWAWARYRHRPLDPEGANPMPVSELLDEDEVHDQDLEYVYATVGRAAWTQALAWVALFVVLLYVTGLFVTAAVFALTYLRWGAGRSWLFSAVYAAVMSGVLYLALAVLLVVSVPEGLFS